MSGRKDEVKMGEGEDEDWGRGRLRWMRKRVKNVIGVGNRQEELGGREGRGGKGMELDGREGKGGTERRER